MCGELGYTKVSQNIPRDQKFGGCGEGGFRPVLDKVQIIAAFFFKALLLFHILPHRKLNRIDGTSSAIFSNFKCVAPREICVERNCFDRPIEK